MTVGPGSPRSADSLRVFFRYRTTGQMISMGQEKADQEGDRKMLLKKKKERVHITREAEERGRVACLKLKGK